MPLYQRAVADARARASGTERDVALSRSEFFMGQALFFEGREADSRPHFTEGLRLAEAALSSAPSADAWVMRAENLARIIQISNWTFAMANGTDVEKFARNALEIEPRNAAAQYLIAARWVFAPRPFNNIRRGIDMLEAILRDGDMARDDLFNVTSALGYAHVQQRNFDQAIPWINQALEVYPTNTFALELLDTASSGGGRSR
jgi:tetratricopeptide (TPR) repeat protein